MELKTNIRYTACLIIQAYITYIQSIAISGGGMSRTEWPVFAELGRGMSKQIQCLSIFAIQCC
jgi:hypothetical protein